MGRPVHHRRWHVSSDRTDDQRRNAQADVVDGANAITNMSAGQEDAAIPPIICPTLLISVGVLHVQFWAACLLTSARA